ncbi:MAG TPA: hypothetical protein VLF09_03100 [Cellvibrio sp.]|nr:hypothetical protein [Cellvibrio sp.]
MNAFTEGLKKICENEPANTDLMGGLVASLAYAANNPGAVAELGTPLYASIMDTFQALDHSIVPCSQWWISHYWSSGHKCSKCREVADLFPRGEPMTAQRFEAITQNIATHHDPSCSFHSECTYQGLRVCLTLNAPFSDK